MDLETKVAAAALFDQYQGLLTQAQRQVLQLYLIEDVPLSEIARIMATTRQGAYYHVKKGVTKLKSIAARVN